MHILQVATIKITNYKMLKHGLIKFVLAILAYESDALSLKVAVHSRQVDAATTAPESSKSTRDGNHPAETNSSDEADRWQAHFSDVAAYSQRNYVCDFIATVCDIVDPALRFIFAFIKSITKALMLCLFGHFLVSASAYLYEVLFLVAPAAALVLKFCVLALFMYGCVMG